MPGNKTPRQDFGQAERTNSKGNEALGDLGIEFGPSPNSRKPDKSPAGHFDGPATIPAERGLGRIETISFHASSRRQNEQNNQGKQVKRREVNLSELRQALEESLKPNNSKEELKERIEEEKYEDKTLPGLPAQPEKKEDMDEPKNNKKTIKPGETIKF
jgi:hypothetical protein